MPKLYPEIAWHARRIPDAGWRMVIGFATFVALAVATIGTLVLLVWRWQERIVFQPPSIADNQSGDVERITFHAEDGQELFGYLVGDRTNVPDGVLIAFHGNADLAIWQIAWAEEVAARTGRVVLLSEYRGYGGIPGPPSISGARLDARAALQYARDSLGAPPERIALFGHSLGSAIAAELAAEMTPEVLVLQSPFTSARDMARVIGGRPFEWGWSVLSRVHYDTEARVRLLDTPVWIVHGAEDGVIPPRMGKRVFEVAKVKGELLEVPGAGHNDVSAVGSEQYWQWLAKALRGADRM